MKCSVAVLAKRDSAHLRLSLEYLHTGAKGRLNIFVVTPAPTAKLQEYLVARKIGLVESEKVFEQRAQIHFLVNTDDDFLVVMDECTLLPYETIRDAIFDLEAMRGTDYLWCGAICFNRLGGRLLGQFSFDGQAWGTVSELAGVYVASRKMVAAVQGSTQYRVYERLSPAYAVQRIGFGSGVDPTIETANPGPLRSRWRHNLGERIWIPRFDMDWYSSLVEKFGGVAAAVRYMSTEQVIDTGQAEALPRATGALRIEAVDERTGERSLVLDDRNLVLTQFKKTVAYILAGVVAEPDEEPTRHINRLRFGTSSVAPNVADTTITGTSSYDAPLVAAIYGSNYVVMEFVLAAENGNGVEFREAGLYTLLNDELLTRVTFSGAKKNSSFSWRIQYTITLV